MKALWPDLKGYRAQLVLGPLFKLAEAILELLVPLLMADIIDVGVKTGDVRYIVTHGLAMLGLGAVGAAVPLLPAFPFLMLAAFCFARSSRRLNDWFLSTRLYKNNLESFVRGRGMTRAAKLRIMGVVTLTMAFGFAMMGRVPAGRAVLAVVWVCHILYFIFGIRTIAPEETAVPLDAARTKEDEAA